MVRKMREDQEEISVVRCTDGTYGISRNGQLIPALQWSDEELHECIAFAQRFSQTDHFCEGDSDGYAPSAK